MKQLIQYTFIPKKLRNFGDYEQFIYSDKLLVQKTENFHKKVGQLFKLSERGYCVKYCLYPNAYQKLMLLISELASCISFLGILLSGE